MEGLRLVRKLAYKFRMEAKIFCHIYQTRVIEMETQSLKENPRT